MNQIVPSLNPYRQYTCLACGWNITVKQQGCLLARPAQCGRCNSPNLKNEPADSLESALHDFKHIVRKITGIRF